jgi:hypothetical protein
LEKKAKIAIGVGVGVLAVAAIIIFRKQIGAGLKKIFKGYTWFEEGLAWYREPKNKTEVNRLHPQFRDDIKEFFSWIEKNTPYSIIVTSGYRTFEKQAQLYRENNNNAKAGKSNHNYGFAIDINLRNKQTGAQLKKASSKSKWLATGIPQQAKKMGLDWGGDFNNYHDPIHFFKANMPSTTQMYALHQAGKVDSKGYVKLAA